MKAVVGIIVLVFFGACAHKDATLDTLDQLVKQRHRIQAHYQEQIDSLFCSEEDNMNDEERFEWYGNMYDLYRAFNIDSQLVYAQKRNVLANRLAAPEYRQAAQMNIAEVMMRAGLYREAHRFLDTVRTFPIDRAWLPYYYHLNRTLYGLEADMAIIQQERNEYIRLTQAYRDSLLSVHPRESFYYALVFADKLAADGLYNEAIDVLNAYETNHVIQESEKGVFAITKAQIYKDLGQHDARRAQLIISACADLQGAVREYVALRELAVLLYEEGDIDRAHSFLCCAIEDAQAGGIRSRTVEVTSVYPIIEMAYLKQTVLRTRLLYALIASIALIAMLLSASLIYFSRQREKLHRSDQIKTMYVGRYMEMASSLIERFDEWRKSLHQMCKANELKQLQSEIASQRFTQMQLTAFYHDFDEAFLTIFPDFVERVKELLIEDAEIRIKPGDRLNTDLRVLGCIRLGITDSKQIASFLRYSLSTIYNSRTRMRNLAKGNRDLFEKKVTTL